VIAPAFAEDQEYLHDLGVSEILDRNAEWAAHGVDAILDLVSYAPQDAFLKEGGRLASTLGAAGEGPQRFNLVAQPTPANLRRLAELLDSGALRVHIQRSWELADAADALHALGSSHTQGKLGLRIA